MEHQINEQIQAKEVRLIGVEGEQLGVKTIEEALEIAEEFGLDLVNMAPTATPPVCKVMDYGKFKYEQQRKEREIRKNQKVVEMKEIRLSATIDEHDYQTKLRNAQKFLQSGNKVKLSIRFKGREISHPEIGKRVLLRLVEDVREFATADKMPTLEGQNMMVVIEPKAS